MSFIRIHEGPLVRISEIVSVEPGNDAVIIALTTGRSIVIRTEDVTAAIDMIEALIRKELSR